VTRVGGILAGNTSRAATPRPENAMGIHEDRNRLENDLAELESLLAHQRLSPDTRVTGHAAVTQSRALLLMADVLQSAVVSLVNDGLRPLVARLPDR
jgi:hypothetical protein